MRPLDRKLLRDLLHLRGQMIAVALVVICGVSMFVTLRSMHAYLLETQASYYEEYRFADLFAQLKRAPLSTAAEIADLPGVTAVEPRIVMDVLVDVPGLSEPATGRLISVPRDRRPALNQLHLRRGATAGWVGRSALRGGGRRHRLDERSRPTLPRHQPHPGARWREGCASLSWFYRQARRLPRPPAGLIAGPSAEREGRMYKFLSRYWCSSPPRRERNDAKGGSS